jgi:hypothetical protein
MLELLLAAFTAESFWVSLGARSRAVISVSAIMVDFDLI